jgi:hypothetical protein
MMDKKEAFAALIPEGTCVDAPSDHSALFRRAAEAREVRQPNCLPGLSDCRLRDHCAAVDRSSRGEADRPDQQDVGAQADHTKRRKIIAGTPTPRHLITPPFCSRHVVIGASSAFPLSQISSYV